MFPAMTTKVHHPKSGPVYATSRIEAHNAWHAIPGMASLRMVDRAVLDGTATVTARYINGYEFRWCWMGYTATGVLVSDGHEFLLAHMVLPT